MTQRDIERFFTALARRWNGSMQVILIGGSAAVLAGSRRLTRDVDFEARAGPVSLPEDDDLLSSAIHRAIADTDVPAQFTENIGAWSEIAMPPYRHSTRLWKRFGKIQVRLLTPALYAVSKLRRGIARDFSDLVFVSQATKLSWRDLARACGASVRLSPRSTRLPPFIKRIEYLFRERGRTIWGPGFDPDAAIALFYRSRKSSGTPAARARR